MVKKKPSVLTLKKMKEEGKKITMTTAYDYGMMTQVDNSDIDIVLVGDSGAMTMLGYESTVPIDMDTMLVFCKGVAAAGKNTFLVGDMPFMSYEVSVEKAVENAGRLMKEGFVDSVKLEGGVRMADRVEAITNAGIPVMGHIGLTPQSTSQLGGFTVQGKDTESAKQLVRDAVALEKAGAFAILVEAVPEPVAKLITETVNIPVIGIGGGLYCDGQVLVLHDLLGLFDKFVPKFVKQYANIGEEIQKALNNFAGEVRGKEFPGKENTFSMNEDTLNALTEELKEEGII